MHAFTHARPRHTHSQHTCAYTQSHILLYEDKARIASHQVKTPMWVKQARRFIIRKLHIRKFVKQYHTHHVANALAHNALQ